MITAVLRDLRQDRPGSRVETAIDATCPLVRSDPLLLRHVLINLLDNALKFSPVDSRVVIELTCDDNDAAVCSVLDRGPGLPADSEALSERFGRLAKAATTRAAPAWGCGSRKTSSRRW